MKVVLNVPFHCRVDILVSVFVSHTVGRGFASWPGHTKNHHKMVQMPPCIARIRPGWSLTVQPDCLKGR